MIKLKNILNEVLNNFSVEADLFVDTSSSHYEITNELRALRGVTIVNIITPEDYIQKPGGDDYIRIRLKFVTRKESKETLQNIIDDTLASDKGENDLRIQGVKSFKFREGTLKRL
jgi:hypothetical protein